MALHLKAYIVYFIFSLLVTLGVLIGKLSFGQGLGDLVYLAVFIITGFLLSLLLLPPLFFKNSSKVYSYIVTLILICCLIFFSLSITIWRGSERAWDGHVFISML